MRPCQHGLEIEINAYVDDNYLCPGMPGKDVDTCAAVHEIEYHLPRHFFWICRDSLLCNSMVAREGENDFPVERRHRLLCDRYQPSCELLESAEAAARLCHVVQPPLRLIGEFGLHGFDHSDCLLHSVYPYPFIFTGIPATVR